MINLVSNKQLDIILTNTNKALSEVIKNATPLELKSISQDISKSKDLKSIINTLLKQTANDSSSDKALLNLVKNNPTLKNLGAISDTLKDLVSTLKNDKKMLPIQNKLKSFLVDIKDVSPSILKQKIDNSGLFLESKLKNVQNPQVELKNILESLTKTLDKSKIFNVTVLSEKLSDILNSQPIKGASNRALVQILQENQNQLQEIGKSIKDVVKRLQVHQENPINKTDIINSKDVITNINKLLQFTSKEQLSTNNNIKEIINHDLKAILNKASDEITKSDSPNRQEVLKYIDKLALQIDYNQLVSHLSNASSLFVPFSWEQMKEGHINIHKDSQKRFYVDIDLKLKEYGELNLKLTMYDKNQLNLHIYSNSSSLKEMVKDKLSSLRSSLIESNITPREIRLLDIKEKKAPSPYDVSNENINIGFEVKG